MKNPLLKIIGVFLIIYSVTFFISLILLGVLGGFLGAPIAYLINRLLYVLILTIVGLFLLFTRREAGLIAKIGSLILLLAVITKILTAIYIRNLPPLTPITDYFFTTDTIFAYALIFEILGVLLLLFGFFQGRKVFNKISVVLALVLSVVMIISAFGIIISSQTKTQMSYDSIKESDLGKIQWQIVYYWREREVLPDNLSDLEKNVPRFKMPIDPQTGESYEYYKDEGLNFRLCAKFNRELLVENKFPGSLSWDHDSGNFCFKRTIDPNLKYAI